MEFYKSLDSKNFVIHSHDKHIGFLFDGSEENLNMLYCDYLFTTEPIKNTNHPVVKTAKNIVVM